MVKEWPLWAKIVGVGLLGFNLIATVVNTIGFLVQFYQTSIWIGLLVTFMPFGFLAWLGAYIAFAGFSLLDDLEPLKYSKAIGLLIVVYLGTWLVGIVGFVLTGLWASFLYWVASKIVGQ